MARMFTAVTRVEVKPFPGTGRAVRGPHAFPTREMEASRFNGNRCVLGPSLLVLLSAWVKKPLCVVGSSQCRDS